MTNYARNLLSRCVACGASLVTKKDPEGVNHHCSDRVTRNKAAANRRHEHARVVTAPEYQRLEEGLAILTGEADDAW